MHLLLGRHRLQPLLVALLQLLGRDPLGDLALEPEILQHLVLDEGHALLEGGILVDLVLLAFLDHQLAVDDAVEQRRKHRLQRHVAILLRQRLLGDLELRQPDRLAVDRGDDRILDAGWAAGPAAWRRRRRGGLARRLGGWAGLRAGGLLGEAREPRCGGCAAQDDEAQEAQTLAHDMTPETSLEDEQRRNPFTQARSGPASVASPRQRLMAVDCGTFS